MKIHFRDTAETRCINEEFANRFKELSGFEYPPRSATEWRTILNQAGFPVSYIDQFLNTIGHKGYEDCGDLPAPYLSSSFGEELPAFTHQLLKGLERWRRENSPRTSTPCHVTLRQMAAIVSRSKRQLRRLYDAGDLPAPAVKGGRGKPDEWLWSDVRPFLVERFDRDLPEVFPSHQFLNR